MDPVAALREIRVLMYLAPDEPVSVDDALAFASNLTQTSKRNRLMELIEGLQGWILNGGFRPDGWITYL